jgi:hypothetical protein
MLSVVMLSVVMLSIVMLSIVMLSVVIADCRGAKKASAFVPCKTF